MSEMATEETLPSLSSAGRLSATNLYPQGTPAAQRLNVNAPIVGPATGNKRLVYMGQTEVERWPGFPYKTNVKKNVKVDQLVPVEDARYMLYTLAPEAQKMINDATTAYFGTDQWDESWKTKVWERAIQVSANAKAYADQNINPVDAYVDLVAQASAGREDAADGGGGGGRGGGGYVGPVTTEQISRSVNLTDPGTARSLLKNALSDYLGRDATSFEQENFMNALNAAERRSPTVTKSVSTSRAVGPGRNVVESETMTRGGFNPSTFAEEYAQGMEGAAEYQAATTLLDTFIGALRARI